MYGKGTRPRGRHPIREVETLAGLDKNLGRLALDDEAVVRAEHKPGYKLGDLAEARDRFVEMMPGVNVPWTGEVNDVD